MVVKLFNSLTNKLEIFKSLEPKKVSMYVCGPTTYNFLHIGNLRPIIVFDVFRRLFIYLGYKVNYVMNLTDIDDKIILQAKKENKSEKELTSFYINEIKKDFKKSNILKPNLMPKVTDYINKIIIFIEKLIEKGFAYVLDGDVYFNVNLVNDYGILSKNDISKLKINFKKNNKKKLDFVIWKKTNIGINWVSPWSKGRPGWHTECFSIVNSIFKKNIIDIHGGGFDLKFPHHENEIAQHKAIYNNNLANYWLHNGFVMNDCNKMSKSLGNIIFAKDIIEKYGINVVKLAFLTTHYRSPIEFNKEKIISAQNEINKIESIYKKLAIVLQLENVKISNNINFRNLHKKKNNVLFFVKYLINDLDVSNAITNLFVFLKDVNKELNSNNKNIDKLIIFFEKIKNIFFLLGLKIKFRKVSSKDSFLFFRYCKYLKRKNYIESDKIRKILLKKGLL